MKSDVLFDIHVLVLVLGAILALSALIVASKPNAKQQIDRLVPYQATIGVALVALGIVNGLRLLPNLNTSTNILSTAVQLSIIGVSILLGALFGMGLIAKWIPGNSNAEHKLLELTQKIAPYQVLLGLIGLAAALIYFLYRFKILTMH